MQEVGLFFMRERFGNALFQRLLLGVIRQQFAQVNATVAKQAQMQFPNGRYAQTDTAGAEVFLIRHN